MPHKEVHATCPKRRKCRVCHCNSLLYCFWPQIYINIFTHTCLRCDFSNFHLVHLSYQRYYYARSVQAVTLIIQQTDVFLWTCSDPAYPHPQEGLWYHWKSLPLDKVHSLDWFSWFKGSGAVSARPEMSAQVSWIKSRYIIVFFLSTFPFCFLLDKLFLVLQSTLCFAALYAKKLPYSTPKLAVFKGRINCSLCIQFGTGLQGPLCVLGSVLFKIVVYH